MSQSLEQIVRNQILEEGPDFSEDREYHRACERYVDGQLNHMSTSELLRRISEALSLAELRKSWL